MEHTIDRRYVLGHDADELARLDRQADVIERATLTLLRAAGVGGGERALDLGTGLGHVARLVGRLVGPQGTVVGIDESDEVLTVARSRVDAAGERHVSFTQGDVRTWRADVPFDVVVGRLLLFHMADPLAVVRHQVGNLRPGGLVVMLDYDLGAVRAEPAVPLVERGARWCRQAFEAAGASPVIGTRLGTLLEQAGLRGVSTFGLQGYLQAGEASGPAMLAGVIRSLAPVILARGIASAQDLGLDTLEHRLADGLREAGAVLLPPVLAGAWGRRAVA